MIKPLLLSLFILGCNNMLLSQKNEIPNGDFENWPDNFAPAGYGSFQAPQAQYKELRTVFKSTDALSGKFSVRLKNASINELMKNMGVKLPAGYSIPETIIPAGIWHCQGDCKTPPKGKAGLSRARFPVSKRYLTVCGYYKGTLAGGDKVFISIVMYKGNNIMGGSDAGTIQHSFVTESAGKWKKFEIPVSYLPGNEETIPDAASIEISIVGKDFPQNAYAGSTGSNVHLGTDVLIDNIGFCAGKADVLLFLPKVMNEKSKGSGGDSSLSDGGTNQSNGTNELIPVNENLKPGAQTFVNLDNDDRDEFFDYDPEKGKEQTDNKIPGGDDELIKVVLRIPEKYVLAAIKENRKIEAKLEATKGKDNIRVWKNDTKEESFNLPKSFDVLKDFTGKSGDYLIREVWIEGILAHTSQQGTILKFTHSEDKEFKDEFAITVIGIEKIEWIGRNNSRKNNNELGLDPNHKVPVKGRTPTPDGECGGNPVQYDLLPTGLRVFPDRRITGGTTLETNPRNTVDVKVTLSVKPVKPVKLFFKSFDVDDPSSGGVSQPAGNDPENYQIWVDNENNNTDNRGSVGTGVNKFAGRFPGEDEENGVLEVVFEDITKTFPFEVTMQPGDNFRVAGSCDKDFLLNARNDDKDLHSYNEGETDEYKISLQKNENKQRITDRYVFNANKKEPKLAEIRLPEKYVSNALSVWRILNVEVDYMAPVTDATLTGKLTKVVPDYPEEGWSTLHLDVNISSELQKRKITNVSTDDGSNTNGKIKGNGLENSYQEGKIKVELPGGIYSQPSLTYDVLYNTANSYFSDNVIIKGVIPEDAVGQNYFLTDDDETFGFKKGVPLTDAIKGRVDIKTLRGRCLTENRFMDAYIVLDYDAVNTQTLNKTPLSPFVRNTKKYDGDDDALLENYRFDNKGLQQNEDFWVVYLLFAYKGCTYEDGDPDGGKVGLAYSNTIRESAIGGITDQQRIGAHIFLEGIVERTGGIYSAYSGNGIGELDCIVHEISHLLGAEHTDGGLLGFPGPKSEWFSQKTIGAIRNAKRPGIPK